MARGCTGGCAESEFPASAPPPASTPLRDRIYAWGPELGFSHPAFCSEPSQNSALGAPLPVCLGWAGRGGTGPSQTAGPLTCATRPSAAGAESQTPVCGNKGELHVRSGPEKSASQSSICSLWGLCLTTPQLQGLPTAPANAKLGRAEVPRRASPSTWGTEAPVSSLMHSACQTQHLTLLASDPSRPPACSQGLPGAFQPRGLGSNGSGDHTRHRLCV